MITADPHTPSIGRDLTAVSVAIVIVNYNAGQYLQQCLERVRAQSLCADQVIVIDNNSTDDSLAHAESGFPEFTYLTNQSNLGFAGACNQGIEECGKSGKKYVVLLNPDAFPAYNWLAELVDSAERNPQSGSIASRMMMAGDKTRVDGLGDAYHMFGFSWRRGHGEVLPAEFEAGIKISTGADAEYEVFGACAGAALYRQSALRDVGNFDTDFFCYMEDVDLAYRLRLAGYGCVLNPRAMVAHVGSGISGYRSDFSSYYGHRNLPWVFIKNTPAALLWLLLPGHLVVNLVALGVAAVRGQFKVVWKAKQDALSHMGLFLQKRREIQSNRKISAVALWKLLDKSLFKRRPW